MIKRLKEFNRDKSGSVVAYAAFSAAVMISMAALGVDGSNLYLTKARLQSAADAAALAAAKQLPDQTSARTQALTISAKNVPQSYGTVTSSSDIVTGIYSPSTHSFTATNSSPNALEVFTHRTAANGNPVPLYFAGIFGAVQSRACAE